MDRKIFVGFILTLFIVLFIPFYWFKEPSRQREAAAKQFQTLQEEGALVFQVNCANCHGQRGEGLMGPALRETQLDEDALIKVISRGRNARPISMPAWGEADGGPLSQRQIEDVAAFIANWDDNALKEAEERLARAAHAAPPSEEARDVEEGKTLFVRHGCAICHGTGGGGGPAVAFSLEGRTPDAISRIVRQPQNLMPAFSPERLNDIDLLKIIAYLEEIQIQDSLTPMAQEGKTHYEKQGCAACHGSDGKGGPVVAFSIAGLPGNTIYRTVRAPKALMPRYSTEQLSQQDLEKIIAFIASIKSTVSPSPTPSAPAGPSPTPSAPASSGEGKTLFANKGCAGCHGPNAEGGIGPSLKGRKGEQITAAVRNGKGIMPAFTQAQVSDSELQSIIAFIETLP
ncbi:MAG: c-type cytochrome [Chloroflexi bacterium]|nr:c-type cytochrome [Chloroflexota bacterium]